jgi:hypothetical protein
MTQWVLSSVVEHFLHTDSLIGQFWLASQASPYEGQS